MDEQQMYDMLHSESQRLLRKQQVRRAVFRFGSVDSAVCVCL